MAWCARSFFRIWGLGFRISLISEGVAPVLAAEAAAMALRKTPGRLIICIIVTIMTIISVMFIIMFIQEWDLGT